MLTIKKTGDGYYLATLQDNTEELSRTNTYLMKKELANIVKPHREITLDIKGVKSINNGGYKILQELMNTANTKRCKIKFTSVEPTVKNQIAKLTAKVVRLQSELETD